VGGEEEEEGAIFKIVQSAMIIVSEVPSQHAAEQDIQMH
jgi:hypothetical protein